MPLSKARMRARKRLDRLVKPNFEYLAGIAELERLSVKPNIDALQSTTRPLQGQSNTKLQVKPKHTTGVKSMPWDDGFDAYDKTQVTLKTITYDIKPYSKSKQVR